MHVVIARVDEIFFDGDAASLTVPGTEGVMTILPRHMPLITTLKPGTIVVRSVAGETGRIDVENGVVEVRRDGVTVVL